MKKPLLIVTTGIFIAFSAVSSMAVEALFCIKGGVGNSNIWGDGADNFSYSLIKGEMDRIDFGVGQSRSYKYGLLCGLGIDLKFTDVFGAEADLLYNMKGYHQAITTWYLYDPSQHNDADATGSLQYIEIPWLIKIMVPGKIPIKPFFLTGPSLGILLSSEVNYNIKYYTGPKDTTVDFKDSANTLDLGWTFGAGTEIHVGECKFIVNFQYTIGLSPFTAGTADVKNKQFSVTVGCAFKLHRRVAYKND